MSEPPLASLPADAPAARDHVPPANAPAPRAALSRLGAAWNAWPGRIVRVALALLPLLWLFRQVRITEVARSAARVGTGPILLSLAALGITVLLGAVRWRVMLRAYGADPARLPSVPTLLRHTMVGQYFAVLPTGVAGEAVRGYRVAYCFPNAATSYVLLFVERLAGLLGLLIIAGVGALASPALRSGPVAFAMDVGVLLALACGLLALGLPLAAARTPRLRAALLRLPLAGNLLARLPPPLRLGGPLLAVLLSIASNLFVVGSIAVLIEPLAPTATLVVCARVVPAIILVTYIPLTPGGLGQRELAFAHFFGLVHVTRADALATSLLFFFVWLTLSFGGGLVLLYERLRGLD